MLNIGNSLNILFLKKIYIQRFLNYVKKNIKNLKKNKRQKKN